MVTRVCDHAGKARAEIDSFKKVAANKRVLSCVCKYESFTMNQIFHTSRNQHEPAESVPSVQQFLDVVKTLSTQHCRFSVCLNGNLK